MTKNLIFILLFCAGFTYGQKALGKTQIMSFYDDELHYSVEYRRENRPVIKKENKIYFYLSNRKIHESQGDFDGLLLHGEYVVKNQEGNLIEKGSFNNGLKNGVWKKWFSNGKLKEVVRYFQGKIIGAKKVYDADGNKKVLHLNQGEWVEKKLEEIKEEEEVEQVD